MAAYMRRSPYLLYKYGASAPTILAGVTSAYNGHLILLHVKERM